MWSWAAFLAPGLHGGRKLDIEGETLSGVLSGVSFLQDAALGEHPAVGENVLVIGGGNVAIDVAMTAKRLGAGQVRMVCLEAEYEMPAWRHEIEEAREEGIEIINGFGPLRFSGEDGRIERAEKERGVRFVRARVHTVEPLDKDRLSLHYVLENGESIRETFDMVVLSVGLAPNADAVKLAETAGIALNRHGFAQSLDVLPVSTQREGVYVCGAFQSPKDIPRSVTEASAAAAMAAADLAPARWKATRVKTLPPERNVLDEDPRVGVFVCNCGINIGGIADVPVIREYARTLPFVVHVEDNLFTCSQDTQEKMKDVIREKGINRVVVASCSPRTHEALFQETIREAGINPYLFEMANIRDQNTWVHMNDPDMATLKAKNLVRMAVAKAAFLEPLHQETLEVKQSALIVGGGVAGMEAALGVADQGFTVHLIERSDRLGGVARSLTETWQGESVPAYLDWKNWNNGRWSIPGFR